MHVYNAIVVLKEVLPAFPVATGDIASGQQILNALISVMEKETRSDLKILGNAYLASLKKRESFWAGPSVPQQKQLKASHLQSLEGLRLMYRCSLYQQHRPRNTHRLLGVMWRKIVHQRWLAPPMHPRPPMGISHITSLRPLHHPDQGPTPMVLLLWQSTSRRRRTLR